MIFTPNQIDDILRIIDFQHVLFISNNVGIDVLTENDKEILKIYGVDVNKLKPGITPTEQSFLFGRLSAALGDRRTSTLTYNDFLKYLRKGQFLPISQTDKNALDYVKSSTYNHIKGLGDKIKQTSRGMIIEQDEKRRAEYEKVIGDAVKRAVVERDTVKSIVSEIGHKTFDWGRDLGRIAETELQNAYEYGRAVTIAEDYGVEARVYKDVYPGACRWCIKFYLKNGIGSEPIVFSLEELKANGTNVGKKTDDWQPTVGAVHPFCRCQLNHLPKNYVWSEEKNQFVPKKAERKVERKSKVEITVGNNKFLV